MALYIECAVDIDLQPEEVYQSLISTMMWVAALFVYFVRLYLAVEAGLSASTIIPSKAHSETKKDPDGNAWPWLVYKSSNQKPPLMKISRNEGELSEGCIFMTPDGTSGQPDLSYAKESGPFIMTTDGDLIYGHSAKGSTDFRKQTYNGKDYLTYWYGYQSTGTNNGHGYGEVRFLDRGYFETSLNPNLGLVKGAKTEDPNWSIDFHEHQITDRNTILVTAYNRTPADLSGITDENGVTGPKKGFIVDTLFYELEIASGKVLFRWRASDHVPFVDSHQPFHYFFGNGSKAAPWDYCHINSIELVGDDYLVGARHTWSIYMISGKDGSVVWEFNGSTGGSFGALPKGGAFRWQHDARAHNITDTSFDLSMFDNHDQFLDMGSGPSTGLLYHLELPPRKSYSPKLLRKIQTPSDAEYSLSQGSYDPDLPNGNQLLGYGQLAITREYGPGAKGKDLRWEAQFGGLNKVQSYRAFKEIWHGTPAGWDPSLVVEDGDAYVSWNGASDVTGWAVYTGAKRDALKKVGLAKKKGFETVFSVPKGAAYIQVAAIESGEEVRKSNVVEI